jgi:transcriptional regulator
LFESRPGDSTPRHNLDIRMYNPAAFAENDVSRLHEFLRRNSFATLVSSGESGLVASHLPLLLDSQAGRLGHLLGHMARANPQWRGIAGDVLAIFQGPHTYISPSWYEEPGLVPTWNYVAVHAYGSVQIVEDRAELLEILRRSVTFYEASRPRPWSLDFEGERLDSFLRAIVGFRITIARLEGKWKLSQNHPEERRRKVIRALGAESGADAREIAALMTQRLPDSPE